MASMDESQQRAPSPTPSELEEINEPLYDFGKWRRREHWLRFPWIVLDLAVIKLVTLLMVFSNDIVEFVRPAADWLHTEADPVGWLIPVALFFTLSFPPLAPVKPQVMLERRRARMARMRAEENRDPGIANMTVREPIPQSSEIQNSEARTSEWSYQFARFWITR
ncbi:hypothetical protein AURDEDRAFT_161714 [Auricularia subglabra TFB-10046 SS5]|nr:hypothetical protein AURDEDRAFT_161714 [Auricularia subglabra TFB-10046 SS5]